MSGKSQLQLITYTNKIISSTADGSQVDVVYLDFSKAFDSVVHSKQLHKLKGIGVAGHVIAWTEAFLGNRYQYVRIKNSISDMSPVVNGVPQGSVLGPFLFLIYISDVLTINKISNISSLAFADDLKASCTIINTNDCQKFQIYLNKQIVKRVVDEITSK